MTPYAHGYADGFFVAAMCFLALALLVLVGPPSGGGPRWRRRR